MDERELREILDFAVESAQLAGTFTLGYFKADTPHEMKADNTPVTIADRGAEERLRQRIEAAFPTHGILGEEFGEKPGSTPARWIIDPIDGTMSFISGVPLYSVLVGFEWEGQMLAGVIHMPALGETVYAARGLGCRWNGRPAWVSNVSDLARARLVVTSVKTLYREGRGPAYERLRDACYIDRGWSDAYGYALLATGRAEIVLDPILSIWDTAALLPIVTEAGGTFTDWSGNQTHAAPEALATNGALFEAVMAMVLRTNTS
ncbi:MAG: inositol monophosphatase family protein [Phycisphaerae bacterium]|nr:inositol monophosphatase family protein [Phycisphaerae bacterium]